ncbi:coenzyme PQQ precursor peptide PqqA [Amycolatopsis sacchari]|uniref:Coenzyme PQQ synthesis protein A n=1 Tax=Amycolatopsis sacchari TaxID=115433 RepID=A0A1I3QLA0_9PSEU|nr:pyrroloquinoline quinone precursor peptide PqqA [Amycolatopsis sacchari]SFJ33907.1 coenzyme PQQ precursor peptide PqqA [Amycolatopsis sacchari]
MEPGAASCQVWQAPEFEEVLVAPEVTMYLGSTED